MSFWDSDNKHQQQMARDLGFEDWQFIPQFVYEIIESLIEAGWTKKG